jgi:hypothetical protein
LEVIIAVKLRLSCLQLLLKYDKGSFKQAIQKEHGLDDLQKVKKESILEMVRFPLPLPSIAPVSGLSEVLQARAGTPSQVYLGSQDAG